MRVPLRLTVTTGRLTTPRAMAGRSLQAWVILAKRPRSQASSRPKPQNEVVPETNSLLVRECPAALLSREFPLARQDLPQRPLNPVDFLADDSDRLLVFRRVGQRSDSFQGAADLMIASPYEVKSCSPLLTFSVSIPDELSGQPGKSEAEESFDRNAVLCAVKF